MTIAETRGAPQNGKRESAPQEQHVTEREFERILLERARGAMDRWSARTGAREERARLIANGELLQADSPDRLAARLNRLLGEVRRKSRDRRPPGNRTLVELINRSAVTQHDLSNELLKEAVLEARDFLSVEFLERGLAAARCVGRIAVRAPSGFRPRGTGFLVGPGLLLTNEHVLTSAELASQCVLEMDYEQNTFGKPKLIRRFALDPRAFFLNDKPTDFALVMVQPATQDGAIRIEEYGWLPLDGQQGKISLVPDDLINIIQHPLGREKEVVIRNNRVLDLRTGPNDEAMGPFIHYEADTEKGSSGSPVLNDQWEVVALHHSGVPRRDDEGRILNKRGAAWKEDTDPFEEIAWIGNEGVRVSSIIAVIEKADVGRAERKLLDRLLSAQSPGVLAIQSVEEEDRAVRGDGRSRPSATNGERRSSFEGNGQSRSGVSRNGSSSGSVVGSRLSEMGSGTAGRSHRMTAAPEEGSFVYEIPIRVTVQIGDRPHSIERVRFEDRTEREAGLFERLTADDLADRPGFDERFLGAQLALPRMKARPRFGGALVIDESAENPFELKYHHFSIIMNEERRMAYVSAVNIDFDAPVNLGRKQSSVDWRLDPRLPSHAQIDNSYYRNNDYDRGHLTRRDDAAWGETTREARAANDDTFFYPNAAPQHVDFNQSDAFTGKGLRLWGDLENHVAEQGAKDGARLCVLNGPIFSDDDKPLRDILVPKRFFKIVVFKVGRRELGAVGFVLSQETLVRNLPEERFEVGEFVVRQKAISTINKLGDLDLSPLVQLDRFRAPDGGGVRESFDDDGVRLDSLKDVLL
ncbi:MAG: DNA/RNA non-specific endonuclease [Myxococcales bacterium]|nr:DNA/RNA non-specific endonuclease [Myxococcales bacterium]